MTTRKRSQQMPTTPALLDLVTTVRNLIDARGTNYSRLERATGYSRSHVKNLCEGRTLSIGGFAALDQALDAGGELLRLRDRAVAERHGSRYGYTAANPASAVSVPEQGGGVPSVTEADELDSPHGPQGVDPTNRRDLLGLTAAALGLTATGAAALAAPVDRLAALELVSAGSGAATAAENVLQAVVADYLRYPPPETLRRAVQVQQLTDAIGVQYPLRPADQARVWRVSAIATGIRGWLENNAGRQTDARFSLREAHRRSELLEDPQLIAWTRYLQAVVEDYAGNPQMAEQYARDGLRHAASGPQRVLLLVDSLAGARAAQGDVVSVDQAIAEAETITSRLPGDRYTSLGASRTIVDDLTTLRPYEIAFRGGRAYARLGLPDRFADITGQAQADADDRKLNSRALFRIDAALAVARSNSPDLDRAAELARGSLQIASPYQIGHIGARINMLLAVGASHGGSSAIRELAEEARTWQSQQSISV